MLIYLILASCHIANKLLDAIGIFVLFYADGPHYRIADRGQRHRKLNLARWKERFWHEIKGGQLETASKLIFSLQ